MVQKFFDKKSAATQKGTEIGSENEHLAKELNQSIIRKFRQHKVCSSFMGKTRGPDLTDMQSIISNK